MPNAHNQAIIAQNPMVVAVYFAFTHVKVLVTEKF
jgi:hypothetical protein